MTRCRGLVPWGLVAGCCLILAGSRTFIALAIGGWVLGVFLGVALGRWLVGGSGIAMGMIALWLGHACGGVGSLREGGARLTGMFDEFGAALPLAVILCCAALWLVVVPIGETMRREPVKKDRFILVAWLIPIAGAAVSNAVIGRIVVGGGSSGGWSIWQDVVAQFALPVGAAAAVGCGSWAIGVSDARRAAGWTIASAGGLFLMGAGRADPGGLSAGVWLLVAQMVPLVFWFLVRDRRAPGRLPTTVALMACSASLAGIWPLPGGLARWNLLRETMRDGFGVAWDGVLFWANLLSWALALAAWFPWIGRALRERSILRT